MAENPYVLQTNSEAAQFFGQQNLAAQQNQGGGYGGGGGGGGDYDQMLQMMEEQFNQNQQDKAQEFERNNQAMGSQNKMQNANVDKARERDRKAFGELLNQKQQLIIRDQMLQIQLSQADSSSYDLIRQQLLENNQKRSDLDQLDVESVFEVAGAQKEVQEGIANSYNTVNEQLIARDVMLKTARGNIKEVNEQGNNKGVFNTVDSWNKTKGKFFSVASLPTRVMGGIAGAGEYLYELASGDNVSDVDIAETYGAYSGGKHPGVMDAALLFNNSALKTVMPEYYKQEPSISKANELSSNLLTDIIMDGASTSGFPKLDKTTATQAITKLVNASLSWSSNSANKDPQELQKQILPLLKEAAVAVFGNENNAPELADFLDEYLTEIAAESSKYGSKVINAKSGVDAASVQNASISYSLGQAGKIKSVLNAATSGQMMRGQDMTRLIEAVAKAKRSKMQYDEDGNPTGTTDTYETDAISRLLDSQGGAIPKEFEQLKSKFGKVKGLEESNVKRQATSKKEKLRLANEKQNMDLRQLPEAQKAANAQKMALLQELLNKANTTGVPSGDY